MKSRDEASATETLARETRTDRQLQWRPQLGLTSTKKEPLTHPLLWSY